MRRWISIDQIIKATSSLLKLRLALRWVKPLRHGSPKIQKWSFHTKFEQKLEKSSEEICDWEIRHGRAAITGVLGKRESDPWAVESGGQVFQRENSPF